MRSQVKIRMLLLPDVCSYCVSRNASVNVVPRGLLVACRVLSIILFFEIFGISYTEEVKYRNTCL